MLSIELEMESGCAYGENGILPGGTSDERDFDIREEHVQSMENWSVVSVVIDKDELLNPTIDDIKQFVKLLNGKDMSSLGVSGNDTTVLTIGGGPTLFHLQVTFPGKVFVLCDPSKSDEQVDVLIDSILTPLPARFIVPARMIMAAVDEYFLHGSLAPSEHWVEC